MRVAAPPSFALPGKWDVASGVGLPTQGRVRGVAALSSGQQPILATSLELSHCA